MSRVFSCTIIVDDEALAVQYLTNVLADIGRTELIVTPK